MKTNKAGKLVLEKGDVFTSQFPTVVIPVVNNKINFAQASQKLIDRVQLFINERVDIINLRDKYKDELETKTKKLALIKKEKIFDVSAMRTCERLIKDLQEKLEKEQKKVRSFVPSYDVYDLNLFLGYKAYMEGKQETCKSDYFRAISEFFYHYGYKEVGTKTINYIIKVFGCKNAGDKTLKKTNFGTTITTLNVNGFLKMFYNILIQELKRANKLTVKEFYSPYVVEGKKEDKQEDKKEKKQEKVAQENATPEKEVEYIYKNVCLEKVEKIVSNPKTKETKATLVSIGKGLDVEISEKMKKEDILALLRNRVKEIFANKEELMKSGDLKIQTM